MTRRQQSLLPPTGADAFLMWPRGGNSGDALIVDACERYLRDRGIDAWRSDGSIEDAALAGDTEYLGDLFATFRGMLMFAGGGNIGIYANNGAVRAAVIAASGPRHRCLVFPQSALRPEPALTNPKVTVWCRDATSQALLQRAGTRTALVPDIALYMDDTIDKTPDGHGTFFIKRTPGGDAETIDHRVPAGCDAADLTLADSLSDIVRTLEPYEFVISDRLHGGLIALMMRKKVVFMPVVYHKTRAFYDTWLRSQKGVAFADTLEDPMTARLALQTPSGDFSQLLCQHADPALNHFLLLSNR